ncbi:MAG: PhoH family protein [Erysipelotrichaceae bacterium]
MSKITVNIETLTLEQRNQLAGVQESHLVYLGDLFETHIIMGANELIAQLNDKQDHQHLIYVLESLVSEVKQMTPIDTQFIQYLVSEKEHLQNHLWKKDLVARKNNGQGVYPKTMGQKYFVDAMRNEQVVFALGPAGTGKTYLAVVLAVTLLKKGEFKKIVLTRPAVEAGENLGFLPGDLKEKIDPYLIPLYDGLYEMLGIENTNKLIDKQVIEIAPLAYMRGRTLNDAFIILDEAQNTSSSQMKMFLTRLGNHSKMVITGDETQMDIKLSKANGLVEASSLLGDIKGIKVIHLAVRDIVRNPLVQKIIEKYNQM